MPSIPILQTENLTKSYGDRMLFADVTFTINEGDKVGLIAKNGMGKSTMLKILGGQEDYDSGKIVTRSNLKVSVLEQTPDFAEYETPRDFIETFTKDEEIKSDLIKFITRIGEGLNLDEKFVNLSGGQKKRVAIAETLALKPDLLILDEPTNHLDIKTIEWLEGFLSKARVSLLLVTHDRYFLDRICNRIIEIDRQRIFSYTGNYSRYLEERRHRIEVMGAELSKVKNILRKEQDWMSRQPQARAGKAKYRIDRYYDLKERSRVNINEKNVAINAKSTYVGNKIFHAHSVTKRFGDKCVLKDFSYDFARYDKIGIVGENGVGKSTFIKMLQGLVEPDSGFFEVGETVRFGYYSQDRCVFNPEKTVFDAVSDIADEIELGDQKLNAMQYLQHFLFSPKDQQKYISTLSGGELSRLYLATVLMRRPNFLVLDEPTNDLDIVTLGILEEYLTDFKGCAIIISHDRYFLDNIVEHIFVMTGDGGIKDFPGTYTDYLEYCRETEENRETPSREKTDSRKPRTEKAPRLTFNEKREFETLTGEIESLTKEKKQLEELFNSGQAIADIEKHALRFSEIKDLLDEKEMRWLELSEKA
ncbi:MAG: ABC-F family ATP-binding cassette domain-containing protein [Muribaculaceae bacterium]|nr:ABC-F family ATP-binding cassette domain-containing protein [Muribaculaceae bacterium]